MKKFIYIVALFAAPLFVASCSKTLVASNTSENVKLTKCKIILDSDATKVTINDVTPGWELNDEIAVYQSRKYDATNYRDKTKNKFIATSAGSPATFEGTIANYQPRAKDGEGKDLGDANNIYVFYPFESVIDYKIGSQVTTLSVSANQTGQLSDLGKYTLFYTFFVESKFIVYDAEKEEITISGGGDLKSITPVMKFNVPAGYNAKQIEITARDADGASTGIIGDFTARMDFSSYTSNAEVAVDSVITINNSNNVLSGDLYVSISPNLFVKAADSNKIDHFENNAKIFVFKITQQDGGVVTVIKRLSGDNFKMGAIKDLGTIPSGRPAVYPPVSGNLCFLAAKTPTVSVKDYSEGATFFYSLDGSVPSNEFNPEDGFSVDGDATEFNTKNIKVLIHHPQLEDRIINGLVRNYPLNSNTLKGEMFDVKSTTDVNLPCRTEYELGDMKIFNFKASTPLVFNNYKETLVQMNTTSFMMTISVLTSSSVSLMACFSSNSSGTERKFYVWKKDRASCFTNFPTAETRVTEDVLFSTSSTTSTGTGFASELGNMNAGDHITFMGGGGSRLNRVSFLESVDAPN